MESNQSFSVIVTKASEFLPSLIALFLKHSSHWTLNRRMADNTSLGLSNPHLTLISLGGVFTTSQIGSIDLEYLLVLELSITGLGVLEISNVLDVPNFETTGTCFVT